MSGDLKITFGADLPPMAVDVVAPDLSVVKRLMMRGSQQQTVSVPSEASFLRVHLPSGRTVTLEESGNFDRVVTLDAVQPARRGYQRWSMLGQPSASGEQEPQQPEPSQRAELAWLGLGNELQASSERDLASRREVRRHHVWRAIVAPTKEREDQEVGLGSYARAWVEADDHSRHTAIQASHAREAVWELYGPPFEPPLELNVWQDDGRKLLVRIPGNANRVWARADRLTVEKSLVYSVRVESTEPAADTILNYLCRGDLDAAKAMTEWADKSEELLADKMMDPYAASVGAYLLLKIQRFDMLHSWTRNLADRFTFLPDGCVLWAAQLIQQDPTNEAEIKKYLLLAAERGLPVYTPGLRILMDSLRLVGDEGEAAHRKLRTQLGQVIWDSPLTAYMSAEQGSRPQLRSEAIAFDIEFGTQL